MKKTVLFLIDKYEYGGVTTLTKQYVELLANDYDCIVLGFENDIDDPIVFFESKAKAFIIKQNFKYGAIGRIQSGIQYFIALNRIYKNFRVDIIHFSTTWSGIYAFLHYKTWRKKKITTFHGAHDLEEISMHGKGVIKNIKNFVRKKLQQFILKQSTVIVLSEYARKLIQSHYSFYEKRNIFIVPPYIKIKKRIKHIKKTNEFVIVNFGRAEKRKGIDLLLASIKELQHAYHLKAFIASPILYWHMGLMESYERLNLFTSVHILHKVNDKEKLDLLKKADIFVIPSRDLETFGITMLESLSMGVPVVGTPAGAIPEVLSKIDSRLITESISPLALSNTLAWYISSSLEEKRNIQKKCLMYIQKYHSMSRIRKKLLQIYKNL